MPEISRDQFSQPRLPGFPMRPMGQGAVGAGNSVPEEAKQAHVSEYHQTFGPDSPSHGTPQTGTVRPNPLFDREESGMALKWDRMNFQQKQQQGESYPYELSQREEYVPTWKMKSFQPDYNPQAASHIAANANMLALNEAPMMSQHTNLDTGEDVYMVEDGNHRANAAQMQGRLLLPASVAAWRQKGR